jgi:transposase
MRTYYIGMDVHSNNTEIAVEHKGKLVCRFSVATTIPAIAEVLDSLSGNKHVVIEEGPMADWLYRQLKDRVSSFTVCDPRRNKLIAADGDSDDQIDSAKLAALLRGRYVRPVYHTDDIRRVNLKRWLALYDDRVKEATRTINKIRAQARMNGLKIPGGALHHAQVREQWLRSLRRADLRTRLELLWQGLETVSEQVRRAKRQVLTRSRQYPIIRRWSALPGIGPIRSVTLFVYLDTPWRFKKKNKLWKYCGIGLVRKASGTDHHGRPKPPHLGLVWAANKRLKHAIQGAAINAIYQRNNVFRDYYQEVLSHGTLPSNARHAVARKMLTVMWGMWKRDSQFTEQLC